jgi:hypothetical protein
MKQAFIATPWHGGPIMLRKLVCVSFHSSPGVGARALPLANRGSRGRQQAAAPYSRSWSFPTFKYHFKSNSPMAWGTYMLRKLVCVGFYSSPGETPDKNIDLQRMNSGIFRVSENSLQLRSEAEFTRFIMKFSIFVQHHGTLFRKFLPNFQVFVLIFSSFVLGDKCN